VWRGKGCVRGWTALVGDLKEHLDRNLALDIEGSGGHRLLELSVLKRVTDFTGSYQSVRYTSSESLTVTRSHYCAQLQGPLPGGRVHARMPACPYAARWQPCAFTARSQNLICSRLCVRPRKFKLRLGSPASPCPPWRYQEPCLASTGCSSCGNLSNHKTYSHAGISQAWGG
jgi:hypothetical protein